MANETSTSINFYGDLQNNGVIGSEATNNRSVTNTSTTKRKRRSSKVEKKEGEPSSSTRMVLRETKRVCYTETETDSDSCEKKEPESTPQSAEFQVPQNTPYTEPQETILGFENNPLLDKENKDEDRELPNYSISIFRI